MDEEFFIYEVSYGEKLYEIAKKIGMTEEQLLDFHNSNCVDFNLPWFSNLAGIQKIVVPKNYKNPQQVWKEISERLPPKSIHKGIYEEKYFVQETFEQIGEEKMEFEYFFEINLKQEKDIWIAETNKFGHITNNEYPDKKTSNIGLLCMESIYPISIIISNSGGKIEISTPHDLINKFEIKRKEIEELYTDNISKKYLDDFQKELSIGGNFYKQICSSLLYQLVFPNLELFWKKEKFTRELFIILNSFPVQFEFVPYFQIESDNIIIDFFGEITENCTISELLQNVREEEEEDKEKNIEGQINLSYIFNANKKLINIEAAVFLWNDNEIYLYHQIKISPNE